MSIVLLFNFVFPFHAAEMRAPRPAPSIQPAVLSLHYLTHAPELSCGFSLGESKCRNAYGKVSTTIIACA